MNQDQLAEVLRRHSNGATYIAIRNREGEIRCKDCDAFLGTATIYTSASRINALHRAHVASVILPLIAADVTDVLAAYEKYRVGSSPSDITGVLDAAGILYHRAMGTDR